MNVATKEYNKTHGNEYDVMLSKMPKAKIIQMYKSAVMERDDLRRQIAEMTIDSASSLELNYLISKDKK